MTTLFIDEGKRDGYLIVAATVADGAAVAEMGPGVGLPKSTTHRSEVRRGRATR